MHAHSGRSCAFLRSTHVSVSSVDTFGDGEYSSLLSWFICDVVFHERVFFLFGGYSKPLLFEAGEMKWKQPLSPKGAVLMLHNQREQ